MLCHRALRFRCVSGICRAAVCLGPRHASVRSLDSQLFTRSRSSAIHAGLHPALAAAAALRHIAYRDRTPPEDGINNATSGSSNHSIACGNDDNGTGSSNNHHNNSPDSPDAAPAGPAKGVAGGLSEAMTGDIPEAEIVSVSDDKGKAPSSAADVNLTAGGHHLSSVIHPSKMTMVGPGETADLEWRRLLAGYTQDGPFMTAMQKDNPAYGRSAAGGGALAVTKRTRRAMERVPQFKAPYTGYATSFRRLPLDARLPKEQELRMLYPQSTGLPMRIGFAAIADGSVFSIDEGLEGEAPVPMLKFVEVRPPTYSEDKPHPYMVVLPDGHGLPTDFEDVCANFFERPPVRAGLEEQEFVLVAPLINVKMSQTAPQEAVIARFCEWVVNNRNVEHHGVHLFGKGYGAYAALRTVLEHDNASNRIAAHNAGSVSGGTSHLFLSVTAVLGRHGSPFRPLTKAQDKVKNYEGVHSLVYTPGLLRKQDWIYKFKFMLEYAQIRPPMRNIHFAEVRDHQVYYAINPYEFWNHLRYFRQYNVKMLQAPDVEVGAAYNYRNDAREQRPAFTMDERWEREMTPEDYARLVNEETAAAAAQRDVAGEAATTDADSKQAVEHLATEEEIAAEESKRKLERFVASKFAHMPRP